MPRRWRPPARPHDHALRGVIIGCLILLAAALVVIVALAGVVRF